MTNLSKAQTISLTIVPMFTGCISLLTSATIVTNIYRSDLKLSTTYRRLVFGMSAFDIFQSSSQAVSSVPMPAGTTWGSIGNDTTCNVQGLFNTFGACGAVWYNLSLTIYFLLVVKFKMIDASIDKYMEAPLHLFPILYAAGVSTYIYLTDNYNPAGSVCWVESSCVRYEPDCISKGHLQLLKWLGGAAVPIVTVLIISCILLSFIRWSLYNQIKRSQLSGLQCGLPMTQQETNENVNRCCPILCPTKNYTNTRVSSPLADRLSRPSGASAQHLKDISQRALAYVIAFVMTYGFAIVYRTLEIYTSIQPPFPIILLSRFFYPLQGLFNIIVYTYPHVSAYQRSHEEKSRLKAFMEVIKSGGDSDTLRRGRTARRSSLRKQRKLLQQNTTSPKHLSRNKTSRPVDVANQHEGSMRRERNEGDKRNTLNWSSTRLNVEEHTQADILLRGNEQSLSIENVIEGEGGIPARTKFTCIIQKLPIIGEN